MPKAGVPPSTPVVGFKVTPLGNTPVSVNVGVGNPVAVTVNVPAVPTVNVVLFALVMVGGWVTLIVMSVPWPSFGVFVPPGLAVACALMLPV